MAGQHVRLLQALAVLGVLALLPVPATAGSEPEPYTPVEGQAGRDVQWVPTPPVLLDKMLDMAGVTADDFIIDLGSGDGRNVIAAAQRGARGLGIEFDKRMVALARYRARQAGVDHLVSFVHGDMYEVEISEATVLPLFLMDDNLLGLIPRFMTLNPGTRIVVNGFEIGGWDADDIGVVGGDCGLWCVAYLYVVPAQVEGIWHLDDGSELTLRQRFQRLSGSLMRDGERLLLMAGRLDGDRISFTAGGVAYVGRVAGETIEGQGEGAGAGGATAWSAKRIGPPHPWRLVRP